MNIRQTISSSSNWLDLKAKIDACSNTKDKGDIFELLTKLYLQIDPRYVSKLKAVWLFNEIPTNTLKKLNLPTKDMGIDLIAETHEGEYWAIQCKYKADESKSLTWREISTFQSLAFSKAKGISFGLVATTVDRSANVFKEQKEDVKLLAGEVWRDLDVEFFKQAKKLLARKVVRPIPFKPRKHQQRAVSNAYQHFVSEKATRGKMIMPCGTGKSLTSYWIAKELEAKTIVIAVPSLSLINQTLKAWLREVIANKQTVDWIAICSDKTAGEVDSAISAQDLGIPTNTDPEIIAKWLRKRSQGLKVVFTTYQSGKVLAEASRLAKRVFDLGIMDEAHKTVGDRDKTFAHLLSDQNIKIRKRVFMTATERRYAGSRDEIISMDNPEVYGDTFELLTFKEALEQDPPILSDYKILTMMIGRKDIAQYIQERAIVKPDRGKWDDGVQAEMLAGIVALNQAMEKYPIKHAVSFHTSIAKAQAFRSNQQTYTETVEKDTDQVETFFVSGKTPTSIRSRIIKEFASSDRALISNARCLTEGVDVPNIDGVLFADPKRSAVDIVQAVGRALRLADGKDFGYIIIPVLIEDESDFENSGAFQTILTVLRALASNDERIVEYFRDKANQKQTGDTRFTPELTDSLLERIDLDQFVESIELQVWSKLARLSWRTFEEARSFIHNLNLKSNTAWRNLLNSGNLPRDIPSHPDRQYLGQGWESWGDWLGTGNIANYYKEFLPYEEAESFAKSLCLKTNGDWKKYCNGEYPDRPHLPSNIPKAPEPTYKGKGWISWGVWLGTGSLAPGEIEFISYNQAQDFVSKLGLKSSTEWRLYCKGELPDKLPKPTNIPVAVEAIYNGRGWVSWGEFLGTGMVASSKLSYRKYEDAESFVKSLGLKSASDWKKYTKGQFPSKPAYPMDIPATPQQVYKKSGWESWGKFLGTGSIATRQIEYLSYSEARDIVHKLNLRSAGDWEKYRKGEIKHLSPKPINIPNYPKDSYRDKGWISWHDFLGYEPNR
ncbi:MAG: DEAD/DEAH box helicase family protein [Candidatus Marinimicrobia bacterium]|jgi:superfamily II DNA or RNA helicase|nr:DEAD/DEAH box helicase family protein [Candidatus Neomarinimicrobiota bacterium]